MNALNLFFRENIFLLGFHDDQLIGCTIVVWGRVVVNSLKTRGSLRLNFELK
jgi:hypothetical protein